MRFIVNVINKRSCVWRIMITLFIDSYVSMREKSDYS